MFTKGYRRANVPEFKLVDLKNWPLKDLKELKKALDNVDRKYLRERNPEEIAKLKKKKLTIEDREMKEGDIHRFWNDCVAKHGEAVWVVWSLISEIEEKAKKLTPLMDAKFHESEEWIEQCLTLLVKAADYIETDEQRTFLNDIANQGTKDSYALLLETINSLRIASLQQQNAKQCASQIITLRNEITKKAHATLEKIKSRMQEPMNQIENASLAEAKELLDDILVKAPTETNLRNLKYYMQTLEPEDNPVQPNSEKDKNEINDENTVNFHGGYSPRFLHSSPTNQSKTSSSTSTSTYSPQQRL